MEEEQTIETTGLKESLKQQKKRLYNSYKGLIKTYNSPANFKEPILLLMREGKRTDLYEGVTSGNFTFKHSDGETRSIILHPSNLRNFPNGKGTFEGYICHENFPLPLPEDPTVTAETVGIAMDKTLYDVKKWKSQQLNAMGNMWWKILIGIAIIIGIAALWAIASPSSTPKTTEIATQTVTNAVTII